MDTWMGRTKLAGVLWLLAALTLLRFVTPVNVGFMVVYGIAGALLLFRRSQAVLRAVTLLAFLVLGWNLRYFLITKTSTDLLYPLVSMAAAFTTMSAVAIARKVKWSMSEDPRFDEADGPFAKST